MTPATFKSIRKQASLTQRQLAEHIRIGDRHVRMIEAGDRAVSGPIALLMEQLAHRNELRDQLTQSIRGDL